MTQSTPPESSAHASPPNRWLAAARGEGVGRPPVWMMRQAGRYLPQYQEVRREHTFAEMCTTPDLAVEVSLQPWREFSPDAVIVFYDILFLAEAMGAPLEYTEKGPVFHRAVRSIEDVRGLRMPGPGEGSAPLLETLRRLRAQLPESTALLGFAGAPFTMAAYLVEGDFRRSGERIRQMAYAQPEVLEELLQHLAVATANYVREQVEAGAQAVQLFDTWAGFLADDEYARFAQPYQKLVFDALAELDVPRILYLNGGSHLLEALPRSGATVLSVDWRIPLPEVRRRVGPDIGLQGNLDPASLFASPDDVRARVEAMLDSMRDDPAYVANLGHGVLPGTPVESVRAFFDTVLSYDPSQRSDAR